MNGMLLPSPARIGRPRLIDAVLTVAAHRPPAAQQTE